MVDMYRTAAVVVGAPKQLLPAVCAAASLVKEVMYVPLAPKVDQSSSNGDVAAMLKTPPLGEISHWVDQLFLQVSKLNPNLDLRVLLPRSSLSPQPPLQHKVDVLLSTASSYQDATLSSTGLISSDSVLFFKSTPSATPTRTRFVARMAACDNRRRCPL